jgi:pyruvate formate lyase activating enzyme
VADWVCPGGTGAGFPRFAHRSGPEQGYTNLAVFYHACTFNCLFCQNWYFKQESFRGAPISAGHLAAQVDDATACICFFGGDPTPQAVHSLAVANQARAARGEGVLRICWETNGSMHPLLLEDMLQSALISGGCIKFDLKAFTPGLHQGLCGVSNKRTLANFQKAAGWFLRRPHPPLLVASTLLVPGYVSVEEVRQIAEFIAGLNPDIPYALLAFHPCFFLDDLPLTSRQHAQQALEAAGAAGLRRVRLGNAHLLS